MNRSPATTARMASVAVVPRSVPPVTMATSWTPGPVPVLTTPTPVRDVWSQDTDRMTRRGYTS